MMAALSVEMAAQLIAQSNVDSLVWVLDKGAVRPCVAMGC